MFAAGKTAAVSGAGPDDKFNYVTMLLHGDGTNGAQNNTFLDSSTNNFTITRNGNTTQGSFSPYGSNWSNFFGTAQHKLSTTGMTAFGSNFTLELWIFPTSFNDYNTIFDSRDTDITTTGFVLGLTSAAKVYFYTNTAFQITTTTALSLNTWTHIALVRSGSGSGNVKVYINGVADATTATYTTSFTNTAASIGDDWNTRGFLQYFGYLSNLRAVTSALYTSTFTPSTTPLTAISGTVLLTCQSNRFIDNSSSALVMTVTGTPSVQRFNPFGASTAYSTSVIGGSGYFDGTGDYLSVPTGTALNLSTGDFTIEGWVYTNGSQSGAIFSNGDFPTTAQAIVRISGFTPIFYMSNGSSFSVVITSSIVLNDQSWNHVAVTASGNDYTVWVNGVSGGTTNNGFTRTSPASTSVVGRLYPSTDGFYINGYITNVRVVKGTALYTTTFTPPTAPLTAVTNTQLLLNTINGAIFDNAMMNDLETVGNAQISTSVVKYGTGSMYFDGTGDYLVSAPSNDNILGGGDFTIEFWLYPSNTSSAYRALVSSENYAGTTGGWSLYQNGTSLEFWFSPGTSVTIDATSAITASTWQHVALCRASGTLRLFVNGSSVGSVSNSTSLTGRQIWIGDNNNGSYFFNGYMDDVRITKGYARYTSTFTPPTAAFPNTGPY